ncbi:PAS domain S-box protein [Sphingobacterium composti Ten et al. 2007 non Yoo et al. 2007]|uniref:PAS domain S-box protein n=1 Tax=Sphingobacterium composti TaxID=363260 RepID=UPI001358B0D0|nr:PAS domain S-box protein [Sphingobacterium composti Ten et al. 2007 non Yoo et al. 2007]
MNSFPIPHNEIERINRLRDYDLIGLGKDEEFDIFAQSATSITGCAASLIALMENDIQRIQSCIGLEIETVERQNTVCQYTMMSKEALIIPDTSKDYRTANNSIIKAAGIKFYAGVPILDDDIVLGTICVIDYVTKTINEEQITSLHLLAKAVSQLYSRKKKEIESGYYKNIYEQTQNMICVLDFDLNIKQANPVFHKKFIKSKFPNKAINYIDVIKSETEKVNAAISKSIKYGKSTIQSNSFVNNKLYIIEWTFKYNSKFKEVFVFGRDITEESEKRARLEASERKFRNFFENSIGLTCMHDLKGNILKINKKGCNMLGYNVEEVVGKNIIEFIPDEQKKYLSKYLNEITTQNETSGIITFITKSGIPQYFFYHNIIERDAQATSYVASTALNITEHRKLELDLRRTKELLAQTNAVAQVGGWEINLEKDKIVFSESVESIFSFNKEAVSNLNDWKNLFEDDFKKKLTDAFHSAKESIKGFDIQLKLKQYNSESIWVRLKGIPECNHGICTRIYGIIQNIDASKKLYLEIEKKEAMLRTFVEYVPASVAMFNYNFDFLLYSNQWYEEFGINLKRIKNKNLFSLFPNLPEERKKIYLNALKGITYKNSNERIQFSDDQEPKHLNWEVRPWYISKNEIGGIMIFAQNISSYININKELIEAKKAADLANNAKSEFLANMSHEIRTPLNGVIGFSELLMNSAVNQNQLQYLKYIHESGNSLLHIINEILDFSKIEAGKLELFIEESNIYDLVTQVIGVVILQAEQKNVELIIDLDPSLPNLMMYDHVRLKQILINLIGNAVKFTNKGEIVLKVSILKKSNTNIKLRFSVKDTGIGIAQSRQSSIFNAFSQGENSTNKIYGGTGLGLTISNNILKYMNSNLLLESKFGEGSNFYFDITLDYKNDIDNLIPITNIKNVILVEENETINNIIIKNLSYYNINTTVCSDFISACSTYMNNDSFDLLLLNYSQLESKQKDSLVDIKSGIPMILMHRVYKNENEFAELDNYSFYKRLLKPFTPKSLLQILKEIDQQDFKEKSKEISISKITSIDSYKHLTPTILIADDNEINMELNLKFVNQFLPNAKILKANDGNQVIDICLKTNIDLILMDIQMPITDGIEAARLIRKLENFHDTPIVGVTAGIIRLQDKNYVLDNFNEILQKPIKLKDIEKIIIDYIKVSSIVSQYEDIDINDFNKDTLVQNFAGDDQFKIFFMDLIVKEFNNTIESLIQSKKDKNIDELKRILHKLKGSAATIGMNKLASMSSTYEENILTNSVEESLYDDIINEIHKSLKKLENI